MHTVNFNRYVSFFDFCCCCLQQPHFNQWVNHFRAGLYCMVAWAGVMLVVLSCSPRKPELDFKVGWRRLVQFPGSCPKQHSCFWNVEEAHIGCALHPPPACALNRDGQLVDGVRNYATPGCIRESSRHVVMVAPLVLALLRPTPHIGLIAVVRNLCSTK